MDPFLGQICLFGFNFTPRGWAACEGQLMSIAQNTALFSLLGTTYGGDGRTTFALPDLRGRVAMHYGQGPGLSQHPLGERAGVESETLTVGQMPAHTHPLNIPTTDTNGLTISPNDAILAASDGGSNNYSNTVGNGHYAGATAGIAGGNQPTPVMQPYLVLNYCIAIEGIFPSRQ